MCLKKAEFHFNSQSARRFADAAAAYTEELPWRLARSSERGLQRLDEAVQAGGADVIVTLIRALMSPRNLDPLYKVSSEPLYGRSLLRVCAWLYARHALVLCVYLPCRRDCSSLPCVQPTP